MAVVTLIIYSLSILQLADSLFKEGDYFNAITEYKRAIYLNDSSEYAMWKIGLAYEEREKPEFAAKYFGELAFVVDSPYIKRHLALNLIKMRKYRESILVLDEEKDTSSLIILSSAYGLLGNFEKADSVLSALDINVPHLPGDRVLTYLSYVIPGSGLFLLGEYRRGLLSFVFTLTSGYLTYYLLKKKRYPEAVVSFNSLFLRFYTGNINNAIRLKKKKKRDFYRSLIDRYGKGKHTSPGE